MSSSPEPTLLSGVDRAAFSVAFAERLREHGVPVDPTAMAALACALADDTPRTVERMYWTVRVCLVRRRDELPGFDAVFATVFGGAVPGAEDPLLSPRVRTRGDSTPDGDGAAPEQDGSGGSGLPWATLVSDPDELGDDSPSALPELAPSEREALARTPFEQLDPMALRRLGAWLEEARPHWPRRRTRRAVRAARGSRVDLRATLARSRRTGWEPLELVRVRPATKPRRVVVLCDVSESVRAQAAAYLHLARALAVAADTEVFAFGVRLSRLTPVLDQGTAEDVAARASDLVTDRFGGTRIAGSVRELLASRHGSAVRGSVVVVASDGWDSGSPEEMADAMARLRRRAHRVVWINPRAAASGYEPRVAGMAAALPYCDAFLPAHTFASLRHVVEVVADEAAGIRVTEARTSVRGPVSSRG